MGAAKSVPVPAPAPTFLEAALDMPKSFIAMRAMFAFHGFVLDILIINILPFLSVKASDAQRDDKFPWCKGGYKGFDPVKNLEPTHRRFMAENVAYAIMRGGPAFFLTCTPVLCLAVVSHLAEAITIAWEIIRYNAPARAMIPVTLMGVFATQTTLTVFWNVDNTIANVCPTVLLVMQVCCGLIYGCWLSSAAFLALGGSKKD